MPADNRKCKYHGTKITKQKTLEKTEATKEYRNIYETTYVGYKVYLKTFMFKTHYCLFKITKHLEKSITKKK